MGFLTNSMLMRKISSGGGGGGTHEITVGYAPNTLWGVALYGFERNGSISYDGPFGSINPNDPTLLAFFYSNDYSAVSISATVDDGSVTIGGQTYTLAEGAYDGPMLGGPYPTTGKLLIDWVPG